MLAIAVAAHATACATPRYFVIPSVSMEGVYDDNVFYASEDKVSDFIARVSPALEVGHESETLSWSGRYRFDAEAYARESQLNSSNVRQFADVDVEYLPTSRVTLRAAADYTKTDTPLDLTLIPGGTIPGLLVGRAEAERTSIHTEAGYRLTPLTTGWLAFTRYDEMLVGVGESDSSNLETWFEQRLSEINTLSYGYMYRQYRFDQFGNDGLVEPVGATQDSHTPWIGLSHDFNARTRVIARAGPRISESSVDPYVLVSLQHQLNNGEVVLDYERDETTLLGEPRKLEVDALYATFTRRFGTNLDVSLQPGCARVRQTDASVDICNLGLGAVYKINEAVFLQASYEYNFQEVSPVLGGMNEVSRNVIQVGLRFTYPRREPRETR